MAITYTTDFVRITGGTDGSITSNSLVITAGDLITVCFTGESGDQFNNPPTISNSGTAITWGSPIASVGGGNSGACCIFVWKGIAGSTQNRTITITSSLGSGKFRAIFCQVHTGVHATTPVPAGNIFSGLGGHNVSQAVTPTSAGSALWMYIADWNATALAAGTNCTRNDYDSAGLGTNYTSASIRPTTQPRTDAASFTLSETDTSGNVISWAVLEVQAAAAAAGAFDKPGFLRPAIWSLKSALRQSVFNRQLLRQPPLPILPWDRADPASQPRVVRHLMTPTISLADLSRVINLSAVLGDVTSVTAISAPGQINLSKTLGDVTATGAISVPGTLDLSAVLGNVTAVTAISVPGTINLSAVLGNVTATGAISVPSALTLSAVLGNVTAVTAISAPGTINLSAVLANTTLSATLGVVTGSVLDLSVALGNVTAVTAINVPGTINLSAVLGNVTATGAISVPSALALSAVLGNVTAVSAISAPGAINLSVVLGNTTLGATLATSSALNLSAALGNVTAISTISVPEVINLSAVLGNTTLAANLVVGAVGAHAIDLQATLGNATLQSGIVAGSAINLQATLGNTTLQSAIVGGTSPLAQVIDIGSNWRMDYLRHKRLEEQDERDLRDIARIFVEWRRAA